MNETVKSTIDLEDRKAKKKFNVIIILSITLGLLLGIASVVVGGISNFYNESIYETLSKIGSGIQTIMPYILLLFFVDMAIIMIGIYRSAKMQFERWDKEDESILKTIEAKINKALMLTTVYYIVSFSMFGIIFSGINTSFDFSIVNLIGYPLSVIVFIAGIVMYVQLQKKLVNLTKEINPEKRGSVYDMKFRKEWLNSCDEAEQVVIYKSAYKAYVVISNVFLTLMAIFFLTSMTFQTGLFSLLLVASLWLTVTLVYNFESKKLTK